LLPAGAVAGWGLHPLESAAFARRTPQTDSCTAANQAVTLMFRQSFDSAPAAEKTTARCNQSRQPPERRWDRATQSLSGVSEPELIEIKFEAERAV
jgi:hypothetical protein